MLFDGASKTVVGCNADPKFGPGTSYGHWNTATCGGFISCSAMVRSTSQAARSGARGRDTVQHDCDVWWNRHGQGRASSGVPCWNRGRERSDAIPRARGAHVDTWKTTVHSTADTNHDYAPVGSKNIRMKDSGDVLEIEDDRGTIHTEKLVRAIWTRAQSAGFFSRKGWKLPDGLRYQLKYDPFMASDRHEKCSYGKYEFKDEKQTKLVPTTECYGLDALETVKTSTGETSRNDDLPEDLWPNLNAMVTRLEQLYIGSQEEKLTAREHGFDRDFWAGSPSDRTTKLYRVRVKPRSSMFDPRLCQAHWNWDQYQRQETTLKHDSRTWSPSQTVQPKQLLEPGVASARSDEGDSGIEDDGIQTNSDATVRPVTLPEGWTVVLNSLRQVVYCHVKSGIACVQMPENSFENGARSGSGDLSQKDRSDCKRKLSNRPESNKLKISRESHPQRSSQCGKSGHGQITVLLDRPLSNKIRQPTRNKTHKNSGTNATRYHRIETSCTLAWR